MFKLIILFATLIVSGCSTLPAVKSFSADTVTLADSIDLIAQDTSASCLRRLALDSPIKGLSQETRLAYANTCTQLKQATELFIALNGTTRAYGTVLGQLADNKLVSFGSEIDKVKNAVAKIQNGASSPYFDAAQLNGVSSIADLVMHAATDAYRQKELKRVLNHHEELAQLAGELQYFIERAYLPTLANEAGNLDSLAETLTDRHLKSEPLRTRELLELLQQQRTSLADRKQAAVATLAAIGKMLETHRQLQQNADRLDSRELAQFLSDYGKQIQQLTEQIKSSF